MKSARRAKEAPRPVASVIIPAWNASAFLQPCLRSAQQQSESGIEIIVADDGSVDDTAEIVLEAAMRDPRVRLLRSSHATGPSAARNRALAAARGEWIVLLDSDDCFEQSRIADLVAAAKARRLDMLADNLTLINQDTGEPLGVALDPRMMSSDALLSLRALLRSDWPGRNTRFRGFGFAKPIIRRAWLEQTGLRYCEEVKLGEDFLFYAQALSLGARYGLYDKPLYRYTVRKDSTSHRLRPTRELVDVNVRIAASCQEDGDADVVKLLRQRQAALEFQVFTWALKAADGACATESFRRLGPFALGKLGLGKLITLAARRIGQNGL